MRKHLTKYDAQQHINNSKLLFEELYCLKVQQNYNSNYNNYITDDSKCGVIINFNNRAPSSKK